MRQRITPEDLKAWRHRAKFTQARAAKYLNTSPRTYENWEQGHRSPPNAGAILKLMKLVRHKK